MSGVIHLGSNSESGVQVLEVLISIAILLVLDRRQIANARKMIADWADKEGLNVVFAKQRYVRTGPFFYRFGNSGFRTRRHVFRITVKDREGEERCGWLRLEGWGLGVSCGDMEVIWDR